MRNELSPLFFHNVSIEGVIRKQELQIPRSSQMQYESDYRFILQIAGEEVETTGGETSNFNLFYQ